MNQGAQGPPTHMMCRAVTGQEQPGRGFCVGGRLQAGPSCLDPDILRGAAGSSGSPSNGNKGWFLPPVPALVAAGMGPRSAAPPQPGEWTPKGSKWQEMPLPQPVLLSGRDAGHAPGAPQLGRVGSEWLPFEGLPDPQTQEGGGGALRVLCCFQDYLEQGRKGQRRLLQGGLPLRARGADGPSRAHSGSPL